MESIVALGFCRGVAQPASVNAINSQTAIFIGRPPQD
jgi:hypothetical protein